jgi:hypothetical protein
MNAPLRIDEDFLAGPLPYLEVPQHSARPARRRAYPALVPLVLLLATAAAAAASYHIVTLRNDGLRLEQSAAPGASVRLDGAGVERSFGFATVTGSATNVGALPLEDVEAVVELLDASGRTLRLEAGLIAYSRLEGGAESPFTVTMPDEPRAVSYRVHFRKLLGDRLD